MKNIFVTEPFLPPLEEFVPYLEAIWDSKFVTNGGPFHQKLEKALTDYLGVSQVSLFTNATIALITALKALDIKGEVITTPYSFVATSHALLWNDLRPVFVDINPKTFNIDPLKIEEKITEKTSAILAVHCYGNPCDTFLIEKIAQKYDLKVIYDAAHAFGVEDVNGSILNHGDLSVLSFHATKVFNTFEGGAIISHTNEMKSIIDRLKNFGHNGECVVELVGINGKMSEFNAALGLLQLEYFPEVIKKRRMIDKIYRDNLSDNPKIQLLEVSGIKKWNYSYFPIIVNEDGASNRDAIRESLLEIGVVARRYFFPTISSFPMYQNIKSANKNNLSIANNISERVLCLPIYPNMNMTLAKEIAMIINKVCCR